VSAIYGSALMKDLEVATNRDFRSAVFTRERIHDDSTIAIDSLYDASAAFLV
jgi:hypothetical protein